MEWINVSDTSKLEQGAKVLCTDGEDFNVCYVSNQFEFVPDLNHKLCYSEVTHYMIIELPDNENWKLV